MLQMSKLEQAWSVGLFLGFLLGSLYAISFSLPVVKVDVPLHGIEMTWDGTSGSLNGWQFCLCFNARPQEVSVFFNWLFLANLAFWIGVFLLGIRRWRGASVAGFVAIGLAGAAFFFLGGRLLVGFYLWFGSMVMLTVAGFICSLSARHHS